MSDIWSETLHTCTFGGLELDCLTTNDTIDRSLVVHPIIHRNGAAVYDMGGLPRTTECRLIFFERDPLDESSASSLSHLERLDLFVTLTQRGIAQEFVHPFTGTYRAFVDRMSFGATGETRDVVTVDCTFVEDAIDPTPFDVLHEPGSAGAQAVRVRVDNLNTALDDAELESDIPAAALAAVDLWDSGAASGRSISLQLQSLSNSIADAQDDLELASNINNYPVWEAFQHLNFELRNAARQFRQTSPTLFTHVFTAAVPLIAWTASVYGAGDSQAKYDEIREINDIDDPMLIPEGTVIQAPPATQPGRQGLRSAPP